MSARAYVLLDITDGKSSQAVEDLRGKAALASVETVTEDICLLPAQDDLNINASPKLSSRRRKERGGSK